METLLIKYGYALLFLGVAVEGEFVLLAAAFLAHRGILSLPVVVSVAVAANCLADQVYYLIARARGLAWLESRFGRHKQYAQAVDWMTRHSNWLLLGSRYVFGFRIVIPAACGALGMPLLRFTLLNLVAGIIWAVPVALLGFHLGNTAAVLLADAKRFEMWLLLLLLLVAIALLLFRHLKRTEWLKDLRLVDFHSLAPTLIGAMGVINLASAIWPRSIAHTMAIQSWLPLEVTQGSRALMLFSGVALLQVTNNLARRKELAWNIAIIALSASILLHVTRAFDLHHSLVAGALLIYLIYFRRRFNARSDPSSIQRGLVLVPVLAIVICTYGYVGLVDLRE